MSSLAKLKAAESLEDVAGILGFKPSRLAYIIYKVPDAKKYSEFEIPKRGGGTRKIKAPEPRLKVLQRRLANLLYLCLADIDKEGAPRRPLSHGFTPSLSIVTNASAHKRRRYVLNLDLKDFFPSINFGRLRGMLMKDKRFELHPKVATVVAQIACHDNSLPQGSPCSPVLSNIVGHLLDIRLVRLAKKHKCTYSRYADDITFSTNQANFPADLAAPTPGTNGLWSLGSELVTAIGKAGFEINGAKTRMQVRGSRQLTTGLVVNEKVNIRSEYYREARAMSASLFSAGSYYKMIPATLAGGMPGDPDVKQELPSLAMLQGVLDHIYSVRNSTDRRDGPEKKKNATATRRLYRKFLFYKNFVALDLPLIVPEGKTDTIYLRAAIQRLTKFHPQLGAVENGKLKTTLRFLNLTRNVHDVLQLGGGTGDFKFFMLKYKELMGLYKHKPLAKPVILLIDNDDGANDIFPVAKNLGSGAISHTSSNPFYRLSHNLYLVKTPETGASNGKTCIEDLFDASVLAVELDGKKFDPNKKHGEDGKYGKARFAEKVVRPNIATIDFSKFEVLLSRIIAVLDDYSAALSLKEGSNPHN
ncbi:retron Ec67 family RNA-directed DNA polymerase/endonuclease [Mesorhizobium sp. M1406]|uniref:retron Ec67 family RNA-directed DNA polymerase/endonuclease n=1 Tax=Mesorhizobium sp. M1406 TaxID=2957099 RepID=UPI003336841C